VVFCGGNYLSLAPSDYWFEDANSGEESGFALLHILDSSGDPLKKNTGHVQIFYRVKKSPKNFEEKSDH